MNANCLLAGRALRLRLATTTVSLAALLSFSGSALAGEPSAATSTATSGAATSSSTDPGQADRTKEATSRFERGLALYDEGNFGAALVEFNRAYQLSPTYKIFYNIGKINRVNNDYASALTYFQDYLKDGGAEVPPERREEVEKEIAILKDRVAVITITANVKGATVYVDDNPVSVCSERLSVETCVGMTPLPRPVIVNPGKRKITATKRGYMNAYANLTLAGGDKNTVNLDLFDVRQKTVDTAPRDRAIIAWSVTGALAIGAGVMGGLTLAKKNTYDDHRALPPCKDQTINSNSCLTDTAGSLASDKKTTKNFALVTDILTGAAVVGAGVSIYLTVKATNAPSADQKDHAERTRLQGLRLTAGLGTAALAGSF